MQLGGETGAPSTAAPELGQHTQEILPELGRDWAAIAELYGSGVLG